MAVPDTPADLTAVAGNRAVALSWTAPSDDGGLALAGYRIEQSTDGTIWTVAVADTGSATTSHTLTGLTNGIQLGFRVSALNSEGVGAASGTATATPRTVPGAPTIRTVTPANRTLTLSYAAPASDGGSPVTRYEYSVNGGTDWSAVPAGSTVGELVVGGLSNGVTYAVTMRAVNVAGAGPASPTLGAAPVLQPIMPPGSNGDNEDLRVPIGNIRVLVNGVDQPADVTTTGPWRLSGDGFAVQLEAIGTDGEPLPTNALGRLVVTDGGQVVASGEGFMPGSTVDVWLFSTPVLLGEISVGSDGTFERLLALPDGIEAGEHTVQLNGLGADGSVRSVSTGLLVEAAATPPTTVTALPSAVTVPLSTSDVTATTMNPSADSLARTGTDAASAAALGLMLVMGGALVLSRTRRPA